MDEEEFKNDFFLNHRDKIMGANNLTPAQLDFAGMENHPENRLMGIHPDQPIQQEGGYPVQQQQQIQQGMLNPFNNQNYAGMNIPDVPVTFNGGISENLLNDNEVPKEIRNKYWFVFHKDNTLTFLDDARKQSKMLNFDILKIDMLNAIPYYDYTFDKELEFNMLRNVFETKLDRALGMKGGGNNKNERIMLQSQFSEQRHINEDGNGNQMKGQGFFSRLLARR